MKKRILSIVLSLTLCLSLLPATALAAVIPANPGGFSGGLKTYSWVLEPGKTGESFYNLVDQHIHPGSSYARFYEEELTYIAPTYVPNASSNTTYDEGFMWSECKNQVFQDGKRYYVYAYCASTYQQYIRHEFYVDVTVAYTLGYSTTGAPGGLGGIKVNNGNPANSGSVTMKSGNSVSFEVVPVQSHTYTVDTGGASYTKSGNTYTFSNVNQNFDFKVTYTPSDFATVTFTQPEGATITVNGQSTSPVQVISGFDYQVSVAAKTGYQLSGVTFDGTSKNNSFTFTAGAKGTTHTVSATTAKQFITVKNSATFHFTRDMTSQEIAEALFELIYVDSTPTYTKDQVTFHQSNQSSLKLQSYIDTYTGEKMWSDVMEIPPLDIMGSQVDADPIGRQLGGLQLQLRITDGLTESNTCAVTLIDAGVQANGTISKSYTGSPVSLSMTNGEDFTWKNHYTRSELSVYQYYDSGKNEISAPVNVGSYYVRLCLTEYYPSLIGESSVTSYSDYIPFRITKATLDRISIPESIVPVGGQTPVTTFSGNGYNAAISWTPNVSTFTYNSEYTATITLTSDGNSTFATQNFTTGIPDGAQYELISLEKNAIVVKLTFRSAAEKILSIAAADVVLEQHYTDAAALLAANVLPATLAVTTESGTVHMPVTWSFTGTYNSVPEAENNFDWTISENEYTGYDTNGVSMTGIAKVINAGALSVSNSKTDAEVTYTGPDFTYDVTQLFTLDENAGTPAYTLIAGGTGAGMLNNENKLTITKAGTFQIQVITAAQGIHAAGEAITATLTVNKSVQKALVITGQPATVVYSDVFTLGAEGGTIDGAVTWAIDSGSNSASVNETTGEVTITGVGEVTITATMTGNDLYDEVRDSVTFTPEQKKVTVTGTTIQDKTYDGNTSAVVETIGTVSGVAFNDELGITVTAAFDTANAAENKTVGLRFELTGDKKDCYQIDTANSQTTDTAAITPLDISNGTVGDFAAMTYNGTAQTPQATVTKNGLTATGSWSTVTDVADKTTFTANGNFIGSIADREDGMLPLNITEAKITLGEALTYNGEAQTQTVSSVAVNELTVPAEAYMLSGNTATNADTYTLTITAKANTNFIGSATKSFAIAQKEITRPAQAEAVTYNSADQTYGVAATAEYTVTGSVQKNANESGYDVTIALVDKLNTKWDDGTTDHLIHKFVINKKALTITVDDKFAYVGSQKPDLSAAKAGKDYVVDGLAGNDTISVTLSYVTEPNMNKTSDYEITASAADSNYAITVVNGKLEVRYYPDPTYTPTVDDTTGGDTTVSNKYPEQGDKVTITPDPDKGYEIGTITVTDSKGNEVEVKNNGDGTYSYVQPAGEVTITVAYVPKEADFTDVHKRSYYYDAVNWAVTEGITNGVTATTFVPDMSCTRAQAVTFLWRAAGSPKPNSTEMPFTDVAANSYYYDAVLWAVENGITIGTSTTTFTPNAQCTRGQIVTFLWRSTGMPAVNGTAGFTDVADDAYYAAAVRWAVENGITYGTGTGTFSPDAKCTRAQIVTFLYRFMAE